MTGDFRELVRSIADRLPYEHVFSIEMHDKQVTPERLGLFVLANGRVPFVFLPGNPEQDKEITKFCNRIHRDYRLRIKGNNHAES